MYTPVPSKKLSDFGKIDRQQKVKTVDFSGTYSRSNCPCGSKRILYLFSNQGRNFESRIFAAMCDILQIQKSRTTPYRPSANGQAERYNRTLMDAVRCFIGKNQNQYDIYLPQLAGAIRSSVSRSTGYTANTLMLGR